MWNTKLLAAKAKIERQASINTTHYVSESWCKILAHIIIINMAIQFASTIYGHGGNDQLDRTCAENANHSRHRYWLNQPGESCIALKAIAIFHKIEANSSAARHYRSIIDLIWFIRNSARLNSREEPRSTVQSPHLTSPFWRAWLMGACYHLMLYYRWENGSGVRREMSTHQTQSIHLLNANPVLNEMPSPMRGIAVSADMAIQLASIARVVT